MLEHKIFKTPIGNLQVIKTPNKDFPGIDVEYQGQRIARVEVSEHSQTIKVFTWVHGQNEYEHRTLSMIQPIKPEHKPKNQIYKDDILKIIAEYEEGIGTKAQNHLVDVVNERMEDEYDYSDYNTFIRDTLFEVASGDPMEINKIKYIDQPKIDFDIASTIYQDIAFIADEYAIIATADDYEYVANKYHKEYDNSDYNEYILKLIREEKQKYINKILAED